MFFLYKQMLTTFMLFNVIILRIPFNYKFTFNVSGEVSGFEL